VTSAPAGLRRATRHLGGHRGPTAAARVGFLARAGFYAVLAWLTISVVVEGGHTHATNAHGALAAVTSSDLGVALVAAAAAGFVVLGITRVVAGIRHEDAEWWQRVTTGLQGLSYLAVSSVPIGFLLGNRQEGSERSQHHETADLLGLPGGRVIVVVAGLIVLAVSAWQIRTAWGQDFTDGMDLAGQSGRVKRLVVVVGTVGIAARALVFAPIGVFLVVAGVQADPNHAKGLDAELALLAANRFGPVLLSLVAFGLAVFAVYSVLEARFRDVDSSR
jgi:Domain of Unknown Function (DUF1206)